MTNFFWCLEEDDKEQALRAAVRSVREVASGSNVFYRDASDFIGIPGAAFSYWAPDSAIRGFKDLGQLETDERMARSTNDSGDDFRFIRSWWEVDEHTHSYVEWRPLCKGGEFSRYYSDVYLVISWNSVKGTYHGFLGSKHRPLEKPASADLFLRPGLTWSRRTNLPLSVRVMPAGCNFAQKGPAIFYKEDSQNGLLSTLAIVNSSAFFYFIDFLCAAVGKSRAYDMGLLQKAPFPDLSPEQESRMAGLALLGWGLKRELDSVNEISHAFQLPEVLAKRVANFRRSRILENLDDTQSEIDDLSRDFFGLDSSVLDLSRSDASEELSIERGLAEDRTGSQEERDLSNDEASESGLLSWAVGVAFGRFDWRIATGDRKILPEIDPFSPIPERSPGMLPEGYVPFHSHQGILADDQGHPHDLTRIVEEVLTRVNTEPQRSVRDWLQKSFFKGHLKQYSKRPRKAPIYWPLSTASGSYTIWVHYPELDDQTLFTAANDFIEPKIAAVDGVLDTLRAKSGRTTAEEREFEKQQDLRQELVDLCDTILEIAPNYKPNHDDGVQITAAPLWLLHRHKPWQKVLQDTWGDLEAGEYDWAHLAYSYWPDRVREKCKTDKSLAIAHDLEELYEEPEA